MVSSWLSSLGYAIAATLTSFVLLLTLRSLLRRDRIAGVAFIVLASVPPTLLSHRPLIDAGFALTATALSLCLITFPLVPDVSAWYTGSMIFALATVLVLAVWSFQVALAGRRVLGDEFLAAGD